VGCAVILTSLPDLPPRPETAANAAFRRNFYARWGRENAIVCGRSTQAEYARLTQTLSIKTAWGGSERYFLDRRDVAVDDDNFLVLNDGSTYGSLLSAHRPAWTFCVFFRPGMQREVRGARAQTLDAALARPIAVSPELGFSEHLRPHDAALSARLRHLRDRVLAGERDEVWLEEQLLLVVNTLLGLEERSETTAQARLAAARPTTRRELVRRLRLASDFIQSSHTQPLSLDDMASVACLSRFHFVRHFGQLFGTTPHAFLTRKRAAAARRLMDAGQTDREHVAQACGFGNRWALQRALRRHPADA
jgi:AraC-like DNA-binding protein